MWEGQYDSQSSQQGRWLFSLKFMGETNSNRGKAPGFKAFILPEGFYLTS